MMTHNNQTNGNTATLNNANVFVTSDECHNYGSVDGCDPDCPVFCKRKCELQESNIQDFKERGLDMHPYYEQIEDGEYR